ncbi:hypothetical protein QBC38DRAFT_471922 [Podospora fimiseda]|uniref:Prolyl 4-hydroxylase alpha subunit domain-containing protein n=1 Tax=Podospora fimiseda TaxID=252190 RepID=A0AAN7BUG6_9PEZI|nr:hypothetical protein QBC38DRAFT_471922 [Podospora fimiseda]
MSLLPHHSLSKNKFIYLFSQIFTHFAIHLFIISKMFNSIKSVFASPPKKEHPTIKKHQPVQTSYVSLPVIIPDNFLSLSTLEKPISNQPINWETSPIPENKGKYAIVLDHVLSPSECTTLISLAEQSVPLDNPTMRGEDGSAWMPALVNIGAGFEVLSPDYRRSDRIVWDTKEIVERLWKRIETVEEVKKDLEKVRGGMILGRRDKEAGREWEMVRVNERLRFLRYGVGDFFKPHCDAPFCEKDYLDPEGPVKTLFTVHLYLNDSKAEVGDEAELVGGATTIFSNDEKRRLDVNPKAGRVLIFQHNGVLHSGDDVKQGVKFSVRTDIIYRQLKEDGETKKDEEDKKSEEALKKWASEGVKK